MGYTHYWSYDERLDQEALGHALADVRRIVEAVQRRGIVLRGGLGQGEPEVSEQGISLNGDRSQNLDHESFSFPMLPDMAQKAKELHGGLWDFCKTARKPYDLAVCAILLVLKHYLGRQIRISSDGGREPDEWLPAEDLVEEVLGYRVRYTCEDTFPWRTKPQPFRLSFLPPHWMGRLLMTRGVNDRVAEDEDFARFVTKSLRRHAGGDWGDLCQEDKRANDEALALGDGAGRLFSAYEHRNLPKIWIITEADRSATTVLFPDEY